MVQSTYEITVRLYNAALRLQTAAQMVVNFPDSSALRSELKRAVHSFEAAREQDLVAERKAIDAMVDGGRS